MWPPSNVGNFIGFACAQILWPPFCKWEQAKLHDIHPNEVDDIHEINTRLDPILHDVFAHKHPAGIKNAGGVRKSHVDDQTNYMIWKAIDSLCMKGSKFDFKALFPIVLFNVTM